MVSKTFGVLVSPGHRNAKGAGDGPGQSAENWDCSRDGRMKKARNHKGNAIATKDATVTAPDRTALPAPRIKTPRAAATAAPLLHQRPMRQ